MNHQTISFIKSAVRIIGFLSLIPFPFVGVVILVVAEVVGIIEEV